MRTPLIIAAIFALAACQQKERMPQANETVAAPAADSGPQKGVDRSHRGQPFPKIAISDPYGRPTDLHDPFVGHVPVLINLWATWCAPCVKELPTLNAINTQEAPVGVIAISQDSGPQASVAAFLTKLKAYNLAPYHDPKMSFSSALGPETVLPTSILYDADGKEVWRYVGDLDWTSPEAARLLAEAGRAKPAG